MQTTTAFAQLCNVMPGGVNSPARAFCGLPIEPLVIAEATGADLIDATGRKFLDFCCSWGSLILGHSPPEVVGAVQGQLQKGTSFGMTSLLEERVATRLIRNMPSLELVRLVSTGTEATMSAIRLARGFTGRDLIIKFDGCYHGHSDGLLVQAGSGVAQLQAASSAGVPACLLQETVSLPYNDLDALEVCFQKKGDRIAGVIIEPVAGNMGVVPADPEFLASLRNVTRAHGALLILDEVITGFRIAHGGAQALYRITPDLTCLGKIIGGGFPVAAFGGRRDIMEQLAPLGPVYQAGTLSGNALAMVAADATLAALDQEGFYQELQRKTDLVCEPIERAIAEHNGCLQRVGSMWTLFFGRRSVRNFKDAQSTDHELFKRFYMAAYDAGIFLPPSPYEAAFIGRSHADGELTGAGRTLGGLLPH